MLAGKSPVMRLMPIRFLIWENRARFRSFNNLTYNVKVRRKMKFPSIFPQWRRPQLGAPTASDGVYNTLFSHMKTLLNDISDEAHNGEILAVLGTSGYRKSTLVDALANIIAKGSLKGTVTLNGEALESRMLKVISAYVMHDGLLYMMLTVEEMLMFAAEFRLPPTLSKSKKKMCVYAFIDQLGLWNAVKTIIDDEGHCGISDGQHCRVSIRTDTIHDLIVLFLDEPTSSMDFTLAFMVVKILHRIYVRGYVWMYYSIPGFC